MTQPRLLDLCCGSGGASMGYQRAGFDVVGVDINPQPHYPFKFYHADAMTYPLDGFDVIHASPPCQLFTAYRRRGHGVGAHAPNLIDGMRRRLQATGRPYVIENVHGAPFCHAVQLCGSSFGLDVRRHRLFESNILFLTPDCRHDTKHPRFHQATNRVNLRCTVEVGVYRIPLRVQQHAMGIDWMTLSELSQAIPPAYTQFIGRALLESMTPPKTEGHLDDRPTTHHH